MRLPRLTFALGLVLLGLLAPVAHGAGFGFFRSYWGNVIVNTDTTKAGRELTPPTPSAPVYYLGRSLGSKLGSIRGDDEPDRHQMNLFIAKILAQQGYLGATPGVNEPSLYLVVQWGYMDSHYTDLTWFLGYNAGRDIAAPSFPGQLGPEIWRRSFRSQETETILDNMRDPNYGIIITAFEYKTARTPHPVIYWQTRIALPANGKSMTEALPTMLWAAADSIGRESDVPILRSADSERAGHVKLGELEILGATR